MATNPPPDGTRQGAVKKRQQFKNPHTKRWTKQSLKTGRLMDVKTSKKKTPFKGVRKSK